MSTSETEYLKGKASEEYKHGWYTDIESEKAPKGLNEDIVRYISKRKEEPEWLTEWRLKAYRYFKQLLESGHYPDWAHLDYERPDFENMRYFAAPNGQAQYESLDDVPDEILETFERL